MKTDRVRRRVESYTIPISCPEHRWENRRRERVYKTGTMLRGLKMS